MLLAAAVVVVAEVTELGSLAGKELAGGNGDDVGHIDDIDIGDEVAFVGDSKGAGSECGKSQDGAHLELMKCRWLEAG